MNTKLPPLKIEQIVRPALALLFILIFWATYPHADASTQPYTGPVTVRIYEHPQDEQDAFRVCATTEREARGIPGERNAYLSWWRDNEGTDVQRDWSAAYERCQADNLWRDGKWNWDSRVLVRTETHNG